MNLSKQLKPFDGVIICCIILLSILVSIGFILIQTSNKKIIIAQNGTIIEEYKFSSTLNETLLISGKYENKIILNEHGVQIETATCPDQFCKKKRPIFYNGQAIVCLPNRLIIKIVNDENAIDFVVG